MRQRAFLNQIDDEKIVTAINDAERHTSGEIRIFISQKSIDDPVTAARKTFEKLGLTKTQHRNGVLIFVAPRSQKFAVIGDSGVHQLCGESFWKEVAEEMTGRFRRSEFEQGIIDGILKAGSVLAKHFPRKRDDQDELSNRVERD